MSEFKANDMLNSTKLTHLAFASYYLLLRMRKRGNYPNLSVTQVRTYTTIPFCNSKME